MCIRGCTAHHRALRSSHIITDLLKGASFFPFMLLSLCAICPRLIDLLKATNRMTLFLSGAMVSLYVLSNFVREAQGKRAGAGGG